MLVHADADVLRVDFHEFAEWVLQSTTDRDGSADSGVIVREFVAGDRACGIDAGTRLVDDVIATVRAVIRDELCDEFFGFTTGCSVANGDQAT